MSNRQFNRQWVDTKRGRSKEDYVPLDERDDWDGKVEVLRPYKDHEWTGVPFESNKGRRK